MGELIITLADIEALPREKKIEVIALLEEKKRRIAENTLSQYKPYPKQKLFHDLGATKRERLFRAANQVGKCVSYQTLITHPDGSESKAGDLFNKGEIFPVRSWDGGSLVDAIATVGIKKPAEMIYRLWLEDGLWFECAANHRVLMADGAFSPVCYLLASVPCLQATSLESSRSIQLSDVQHLLGTPQGCQDDYSQGHHRCDAPPLQGLGIALTSTPSQGDVLQHISVSCNEDDPENKCTSSLPHAYDRLSIPYEARPSSGLLPSEEGPIASLDAAQLCDAPPSVEQSLPVVCLESITVKTPARHKPVSLFAPLDCGNGAKRVIAYNLIGVQDIYDFTVDKYHNYLCAGVIHHNTQAGASEVAMHLTGLYPDWWEGKRFARANHGMAGSESAELTRKGVQRLLLGPPADRLAWGTGTIPKSAIISWSMRSGVADAVASITVLHKSGQNSTIQFASYDQGRTKWQADTLDWVWFDEEPPEDVYSEGITRTNTTMGPVILTLTPLLGMSQVVRRFIPPSTDERADINMTIEEAAHFTPEERRKIIDSYPEFEREARTQGIPSMGSGRIFPVADSAVKVEPFDIPRHWARIGGLDFGYDHPTAGSELVWDKDTDTIYVVAAYKKRGADIANFGMSPTTAHAAALKPWGDIPWAWPHDGLQHDKGSGQSLRDQYKEAGLDMLPDKATHPPKPDKDGKLVEGSGGNGVEAGVQEMLDRMLSGRWKVFSHLEVWFEEFRLYHRKDGQIIKEFDDVLSSSRYAYMMRRFARTAQTSKKAPDMSNVFRR
jgi:phage terminase large subunit-like protein